MHRYQHDLSNDRWVAEIVFPGLRGGFFVEAGAANGVGGSATYFLEKELGWSGICVEVIPYQFKRIAEFRSCRSDNRALWSSSGEELAFSVFPGKSGHSGLTHMNKNAGKLVRQGEVEDRILVKTVALLDLLHEHEAPAVIDYLCLDLEGAEHAVVSAFDFHGRYVIRALSIEGRACDELLTRAGYRPAKNPFTEVQYESYWLHPSVG